MKTNINFIKFRTIALIFSGIVILFGLWSIFGPRNLKLGFFTPKGFNYGIDFQGGLVNQVIIYSGANQEDIRKLSIESGLGNEVQQVIISEDKRIGKAVSFIVKTVITKKDQEKIEKDPTLTSAKVLEEKVNIFYQKLNEKYGSEYILEGEELNKAIKLLKEQQQENLNNEIIEKRTENRRVLQNIIKESQNTISATYSKDLRQKALFLIIFVLAIILIYISLRFKFQYGIGAILALFHDTAIMLGFVSILELELDMTIVAAILTLIGYSINDTIVIFDRIRENFNIMKDSPSRTIFNTSINQTLGRTIVTSTLTLLAVIALLIFGGEKIRGFSIVLTVGILFGTYSSIFIAAPIVDYWDKFFSKRKVKEEKIIDERSNKDDKGETKKVENTLDNIDKVNQQNNISLSKKQLKKLANLKKK